MMKSIALLMYGASAIQNGTTSRPDSGPAMMDQTESFVGVNQGEPVVERVNDHQEQASDGTQIISAHSAVGESASADVDVTQIISAPSAVEEFASQPIECLSQGSAPELIQKMESFAADAGNVASSIVEEGSNVVSNINLAAGNNVQAQGRSIIENVKTGVETVKTGFQSFVKDIDAKEIAEKVKQNTRNVAAGVGSARDRLTKFVESYGKHEENVLEKLNALLTNNKLLAKEREMKMHEFRLVYGVVAFFVCNYIMTKLYQHSGTIVTVVVIAGLGFIAYFVKQIYTVVNRF